MLDDLDGARIAVVVHPSGRRVIEFLTEDDHGPAAVLSFTEAQARALAQLLEDEHPARSADVRRHEPGPQSRLRP